MFCNQLRYGTLMVTALQPGYVRGEICSRDSTNPIIHQHLPFIQMPIKKSPLETGVYYDASCDVRDIS